MKKLSLVSLASLLLFTATIASAQSRRQPFKFQLTAVDAKTHRPRSTFFLGETVAVRISLTNQSGVVRTVPQLPDTEIAFKLYSTELYENGPEIRQGYFGGTGWARSEGNMTVWGSSPPRTMTIAPGQTVSRTIELLDYLSGYSVEEGTHTLTATYKPGLSSTIKFEVVADKEKSIPLLEQLAARPVQDGNNTLQVWARASLNLVRQPAIMGRIVNDDGQPLNEVTIYITGALTTNTETRRNGRYRIDLLTPGSTYTITPQLYSYDRTTETRYTLEPASRTITVLNENITGADFVAKRIRTEKNFALDDEGAKAKASSTKDYMWEPERVIDRFRLVMVGNTTPDYWNDGTPNQFPDWIEVDFDVTRKIDWINVFTLPDNLNDPPDPDPNEKFTLHGITDFDVQYWTGRAWRTVPGGVIRGNRNVWRKISFPEITTRKIRVVVWGALGGESRISEIEAIHLNDLPQAKISVKDKGYRNAPLQFQIDMSDPDGTIQYVELEFGDNAGDYEWRFDPRNRGDKPRLTHTHAYEKEGTYTVTLRVVDDSEEVVEKTIVINITDPPAKRNLR